MDKSIETLLNAYIEDFKAKQCSVVVPNSIPIVWFGDIEAYFKSQVKIVTIALITHLKTNSRRSMTKKRTRDLGIKRLLQISYMHR